MILSYSAFSVLEVGIESGGLVELIGPSVNHRILVDIQGNASLGKPSQMIGFIESMR